MYEDDIFSIEKKGNELILKVDPEIEEITRDDLVDYWKSIRRNQPKQLPLDQYNKIMCSLCSFSGIVHVKQNFCPLCYSIVDVLGDANEDFDIINQEWVKEKNLLENIINGNIVEFIEDINSKQPKRDLSDYIGEEQEVND